MNRLQVFQNKIPIYRHDIALFSEEVVGFEPDDWQRAVFKDVAEANRVTVKSGQGVGKTGTEAVLLLWFLCCFPFPKIIATAPTKRQLNDVLWSEVAKWQSKSPLLEHILKWTKTYIYMVGYEKRWFATARTATKPENIQGFHEDNMMFIVDEASGIAEPIMEAILGTLSGANNKLIMCGNPTKTSGTFYESHTSDRANYCCHTVNSENSPRTNKENIASLKRKYGEKSNVVRVRVYGEFPEQEDDVFLPFAWIERSIATEISQDTAKGIINSIDIGCDVARFGDDKTCIGYKINEVAKFYKKYNGQDTTWTKNNIATLYLKLKEKYKFTGNINVKVDDGGVGGGVVDQLRELKRSEPEKYNTMHIYPINFGLPLPKHRYYDDSTTFMMGVVRELIQPFDEQGNDKAVDLILPNDNDLIGQLSCRKYSFTSKSKQKVESKKDMKERGLSSPDEADCILLVCMPVRKKKGENKK